MKLIITIIGVNLGFTFDSEQGENKVFYHEDSFCMLIQEPDMFYD